MRIIRDVIATLLVAATAVIYVDVVGGSTVGFITDPRGVAATGLVLGLFACAVAGESITVSKPGTWRTIAGVLVAAVVAAGLLTVITNSWGVLAAFMTVLVVLWAGTTLHHMLRPSPSVITRTHATHA